MDRKLIFYTRIKDYDPQKSLRILKELRETRSEYNIDNDIIWMDLASYIRTDRIQRIVKEVNTPGTNKRISHKLRLKTSDAKETVELCINNYRPELIIINNDNTIRISCVFINLDLNNELIPIATGDINVSVVVPPRLDEPPFGRLIGPSQEDIEAKRYEAYQYLLKFLPGLKIDHIRWA